MATTFTVLKAMTFDPNNTQTDGDGYGNNSRANATQSDAFPSNDPRNGTTPMVMATATTKRHFPNTGRPLPQRPESNGSTRTVTDGDNSKRQQIQDDAFDNDADI